MPRFAFALFIATAAALAGAALGAPAPVEDYGKLPAVQSMELSPSGDRIAYIATQGEARKVVVSDTQFSTSSCSNMPVEPKHIKYAL